MVRPGATETESLTAEQHQLLGWLERELDRQLQADPPGEERHRLSVWVRMTPAMMRCLESRYQQRGWGCARTRTLRDGTHVLELGWSEPPRARTPASGW